MNKLTLALSAAALAIAGTAMAQPPGPPQGDRPEHGPVTRADFAAKLDERFAKLDVNGDGKLDQADRDARRGKAFEKLDADGNGSISQAEFDAAGGKLRDRLGDRGPGKGEHRMTRRGGPDGPPPEGGPGGPRHGRGPGMGLAMIGKMADTNGDGAISKDEFKTAALAMFDRADANGDGTVTPEERMAMRGQMRGDRDGKHQGQFGGRQWGQRGDAPPPPSGE